MCVRIRSAAVLFVVSLFFTGGAIAQQAKLRIIGWNMEGNGNDISPSHLVNQMKKKKGVDIWGLCEVRPNLFDDFLDAAKAGGGADYGIVKGKSGKNIRLAIIYNKSKLELLKSDELFSLFGLTKNSGHRAPLIAHFRGAKTSQEFIFMMNHLASGSKSTNTKQAKALAKWISTHELPVIAVGDLNSFDGRPVLEILRKTWFELQPLHKVPSFRKPFNGTIDHIFVGNRAKASGWSGSAQILKRKADAPAFGTFSDTSKDTDHRPIGAIFTLAKAPDDDAGDDERPLLMQLLERIERLEERLRKLEEKK